MKHPFINDLGSKTLDELQNKISELNTKLTFAYRTQNSALISQLIMVIESYREEYNKKMDELISKQKLNTRISVEKDSKS